MNSRAHFNLELFLDPVSGMDSVLKPGDDIKVRITTDKVIWFANELYNLHNFTIKELNAYDDKNFVIQAPHFQAKDGYVLKILNSVESQDPSIIIAQNDLMLFLGERGFSVPQPIQNKSRNYYSLEKIRQDNRTEATHIVRLFTYLPGSILKNVSISPELLFNMGAFLAELDLAMKDFNSPALKTKQSIWKMERVPDLKGFLSVIEDVDKRKLVENTIDEFVTRVMSQLGELEAGVIHNDFNESNIISDGEKVTSLLDFGDSCYGPYLFEIAISLCYIIFLTKDISSPKEALKGYESKWPLSDTVKSLLRISICARMCQSLVIGWYSYTKDPTNDYVASTQNGWAIFKEMFNMTDEEALKKWGM